MNRTMEVHVQTVQYAYPCDGYCILKNWVNGTHTPNQRRNGGVVGSYVRKIIEGERKKFIWLDFDE